MHNWPFFRAEELKCKCGHCDGGTMNKFFMQRLVNVRENLGFPLVVSSAYRCPAYNAEISDTGKVGPHTTGRAIDIQIYGHRAHLLIQAAHRWGVLGPNHGGLGLYQRGPRHKRFIHLDDLSQIDGFKTRPWVWTY